MELNKELVMTGKQCPYCGNGTELINATDVYGPGYEGQKLYICRPCFAYVGCHKPMKHGPGHNAEHIALGRLANQKLRQLKEKAHKWFDPIWKELIEKHGYQKTEARTAAYMWLSRTMGMELEDCHIGMFGPEACKEVIHLCKKLNPFTQIF